MRLVLRSKRATPGHLVAAAFDIIDDLVSKDELDAAAQQAGAEVLGFAQEVGLPLALAWSAGKDSIALDYALRSVGIHQIPGVFCVASALEVPAQLSWAMEHLPDGVELQDQTDYDLDWLCRHPEMLFAKPGAEHFLKNVTRWGQHRFLEAHGPHLILTGRRRLDGNWLNAKHQLGAHFSRNSWWLSPIREWPHELVLAAMRHHPYGVPPIYAHDFGWEQGTGQWPGWKVGELGWSYLKIMDSDYADFVRPIVERAHAQAR